MTLGPAVQLTMTTTVEQTVDCVIGELVTDFRPRVDGTELVGIPDTLQPEPYRSLVHESIFPSFTVLEMETGPTVIDSGGVQTVYTRQLHPNTTGLMTDAVGGFYRYRVISRVGSERTETTFLFAIDTTANPPVIAATGATPEAYAYSAVRLRDPIVSSTWDAGVWDAAAWA